LDNCELQAEVLDTMSSLNRISIHCDDKDDEFVYVHDSPKHSVLNHSMNVNATALPLQFPISNNDDSIIELEERQRQQQEEEESIELARRLMAEEAMASYEHHFLLLRESANQLSREDYEALQRVLGEDEFEADGQSQDGVLSYDAMLDLGDRIGDVKTERWAMISATEVNKLPTFLFSPTESNLATKIDDSDHKCLVCQFDYEKNEELRRLPCGHCFHKSCVDVWLQEKDVCPYCRQCIATRTDN
jgi:Ring finger domain